MDAVSIKRIELAHPAVRSELLLILQQCEARLTGSMRVRFTHTLRTFEQQDDMFQQGRTRPGRVVTWARAGQSWHNYGLAVDFCLVAKNGRMASWDTKLDFDGDLEADWLEVVAIFKAHGWAWGGDWPKPKTDMPHFQKTFGLSIEQAKKQYLKQKMPYIPI